MKFTLPSIVSGKVIERKNNILKYNTGVGELELSMPEINHDDVAKIKKQSDIHELPTSEIISFYTKVGKLWNKKSYDLRKDALKLTEKVTGYSSAMIEHSYDGISTMLSKEYIKTTLDSEIGNRKFLDEWVRVKDISIHAQPRGKVLHIMAGNAPPLSAVSILRGSLTKNVNTVKTASSDPVTAIYLVKSFRDVDKDHPITKTTSVVYWKHDSSAGDSLIRLSNAICVWGGADAVESIRKKSTYGTELVEFGPRRSMQLIGKEAFRDSKTLKNVTDKAAHDIVLFDQEACHSPQLAFVEGDTKKFCEALAKSLDAEGKRLPKGFVHREKHAAISHERLIAKFYGEKVYESKGTEWTLIITDNIKRIIRHPLGRMLYVFGVKNLKVALQHIDHSIQTVAVYPDERINELRDEITLMGADRVTYIGKMGYFAPGAPHEGFYPLSRLVRWVKSK